MDRIITFFGADHKCGTSMISHCIAEKLAKENPESNVLLVHAESGCGRDYAPAVCESLDNIYHYLERQVLDLDDVLRNCRYKDNLYIIGGSSRVGSSANYHPEMGEFLLSSLKNCFGFIICDGGCNPEHGMSLAALLNCNKSYLVCTQSESAIKRFGYLTDLFDKLEYSFDGLLVNKYSRKNVMPLDILAGRLGFDIKKLILIPYSPFGEDAENDEKTLLSYKDAAFGKAVCEFMKTVSGEVSDETLQH